MKNVIIIGAAGNQGKQYYDILIKKYSIVALVDNNIEYLKENYKNIAFFKSLNEVFSSGINFEIAILAIPHSNQYEYCKELLENKKHIIKEKPFSISNIECDNLIKIAQENNLCIFTTTQRRHSDLFAYIKRDLEKIGNIKFFNYNYHFNFDKITSGWRINDKIALGGVILDMGYHLIDMINRIFSHNPTIISSVLSYFYEVTRTNNLEDSASVLLTYSFPKFYGNLNISRHHIKKYEHL